LAICSLPQRPRANVCLNDIAEPFALTQRAICFQPFAKIDTKYLMFALMSDLMQSIIDANATGMTAEGIKAEAASPSHQSPNNAASSPRSMN
jgi:type I restriction enzyme, S subunit